MKKHILACCLALVSIAGFSQWTWQNPLPTGNGLLSGYFTGPDTGYLGGNFGTILKTIDRGASWKVLSTGSTASFRSVFFPDPNTGYAVGLESSIFKPKNGGMSWQDISVHSVQYIMSVFFLSDSVGFVVAEQGTILKTFDGGTTWNKMPCGTSQWLEAILLSTKGKVMLQVPPEQS